MIHKLASAHRGALGSRKALLMSCASVALAATAAAPQSASAQAFQGTITSSTGSVTRTWPGTGANNETIVIGSNTATINWSPTNQQGTGTIDFMPSGTTATFTSSQGVTDYTVLNRILPTTGQAISLNGHVISTLQGTSATGGKVWFYSPGGIVIGASAVFDVGGLLLTTNDVTSFSNSPTGFNATFGAPGSATSKVQIANGAQINALQQNSYVAIVAPRIEQGGKVRVNGSAAYAAGEQLTMTMNQGLFDIVVDVGTGDANGVVHTGETSGPANTSAADNHNIYMVAVPKNQAMIMLLGGKVGFDDATSATVENGSIVLGAGYNVQGGALTENTAGSTPDSDMNFTGGTFSSDVEGRALGDVTVNPQGGNLAFAGDLRLLGRRSVRIAADAGETITVGGKLQAAAYSGRTGERGTVELLANGAGSAVSVAGTSDLRADSFNIFTNHTVTHDQHYDFNASNMPLAGTVNLQASNGGHLTLTGAADLGAEAVQTNGVAVAGGIVRVRANSGGRVDFGSGVHMDTTSFGGYPTNGIGGDATGGTTQIIADGGTVAIAGAATLFADGFGGGVNTTSPASQGANGYGGSASLSATNGGNLSIGGVTQVTADAIGGDNLAESGNGAVGGSATGGQASINASSGGTVTLGAAAYVAASAWGGRNNSPTGTTGTGTAGLVQVNVDSGGAVTAASDLSLRSNGFGGNGPNNGGAGYGGEADVFNSGGNVTVGGTLNLSARGTGGSGTAGTGGYGEGGYAWVDIYDGAQLNGDVNFTTNALGGSGNVGGDAYGGSSWLYVEGSLTSPSVLFDSSATGGAGAVAGGYGEGGDAGLDIYGTANVATNIAMNVNAAGGSASAGTGGDAYGGYADIYASDGGTLNGGTLTVTANATAGTGTSNGYASGGSIWLSSDDYEAELPTTIAFDTITLTANTIGSGSEDYAFGGDITVEAFGGSITADSLVATANGSTAGGYIDFETWTDYSESPGQLQFSTVSATANGGDIGGYIWFGASGGSITADLIVATANGGVDGGFIGFQASGDYYDGSPGHLEFGSVDAVANGGEFGGYIYAVTDSGGTIDLGDAELRANGGTYGTISLLAGCCGDGGGGDFAAAYQSAPLPAGGGIAASDLTLETTGDILLGLSSGADISVTGTFEADAGNTISMFDDGTGGAIRAHIIDFEAASIDANARLIGDIIGLHGSEYLSVSDVTASQSATFTTDGLATFTGVVSAPTITVTSSDIDIFGDGSLGVYGTTNLITLNALSNGEPIIIGEAEGGEGAQYVLNDVEIETDALVINAIGGGEGGAPDVHIFNVEIDGSQTAGGGLHAVTLNTDGSVMVNGVIDYANAGANDSLTINAGETIAINTDTGGIQITNPGGSLTGTLTLAADNIWVASGTLLDQLLANPNFEGRSAALAVNSGIANPDGFVRAGAVHAAVGNTLFVQNSGTPELFGGIDTGDGGLTIEGTGSSPATVIAFGRQTNADGTVLTNQDFIGSVETEGQVGFTEDSVVNGCFFGGSCGGGQDFEEPVFGVDMASILGPLDQGTSDDGTTSDEDDDDSDDSEDGSKADPSMRLINTTPINLEQQIDDPVTSGGDVVVGNPAN